MKRLQVFNVLTSFTSIRDMSEMNVDFPRSRSYKVLVKCLLISSLPGKALRALVDIARLASDSTCVLKAESGKLNIIRREPGTLLSV